MRLASAEHLLLSTSGAPLALRQRVGRRPASHRALRPGAAAPVAAPSGARQSQQLPRRPFVQVQHLIPPPLFLALLLVLVGHVLVLVLCSIPQRRHLASARALLPEALGLSLRPSFLRNSRLLLARQGLRKPLHRCSPLLSRALFVGSGGVEVRIAVGDGHRRHHVIAPAPAVQTTLVKCAKQLAWSC